MIVGVSEGCALARLEEGVGGTVRDVHLRVVAEEIIAARGLARAGAAGAEEGDVAAGDGDAAAGADDRDAVAVDVRHVEARAVALRGVEG